MDATVSVRGRTGRRRFPRPVVPDSLDLRDRLFQPRLASAPPEALDPRKDPGLALRPRNQGDTSACTGFALAAVVGFLLQRCGRPAQADVSPYMLYSMARRYDEFPGSKADTGSSLRGAMKGWYRHGACAFSLWKDLDMPPVGPRDGPDWWQDAAQRPLGAYYRVDPRSVTDMHAALDEAGVLYASALCHDGWDAGWDADGAGPDWTIPYRPADPDDGGHAFAIVGYDHRGFLVLNSWSEEWGARGFAYLTYRDWLDHAMDCWVAQLGVVTSQHLAVAGASTLRTENGLSVAEGGRITVASDPRLRNHETAPFIVNMENNGRLSRSGDFRTNESDVRALVGDYAARARRDFGLAGADVMDVAIYAHGGLTGEDTAAETAARWIPALYENRIFPIFLMWESDLWSTIRNRLEDVVRGIPRPTGGPLDFVSRWWNRRLEETLSPPGTAIWSEMKQNAEAIAARGSGAWTLYEASQQQPAFQAGKVRLHLIGHSAGSIVHAAVAGALAKAGWTFSTATFMAPAITVQRFEETLFPLLGSGAVGRYHQLHLTDQAEQKDDTCRPILGYGRSLLYLVSESFEGGRRTPILGMERYFDSTVAAAARGTGAAARISVTAAPHRASGCVAHGDFDNDERTLQTVIGFIRSAAGQPPAAAPAPGPAAEKAA